MPEPLRIAILGGRHGRALITRKLLPEFHDLAGKDLGFTTAVSAR